jgi:hypothetical protein
MDYSERAEEVRDRESNLIHDLLPMDIRLMMKSIECFNFSLPILFAPKVERVYRRIYAPLIFSSYKLFAQMHYANMSRVSYSLMLVINELIQ